VLFGGNWGEGDFGEGFGDTDYGLELTDCDWDGGTGVGFEFCGVDLLADGDEMGGKLFGCFRREAGCTASVLLAYLFVEESQGAYDLQ
jgi:hypothetical protein